MIAIDTKSTTFTALSAQVEPQFVLVIVIQSLTDPFQQSMPDASPAANRPPGSSQGPQLHQTANFGCLRSSSNISGEWERVIPNQEDNIQPPHNKQSETPFPRSKEVTAEKEFHF